VRPLPAERPTHVWAYDFVHDTCANGQPLKSLTVVDEWSRECLAVEVEGRITAARVIQVVQRLIQQYGTPTYIRSDNGPAFVAQAVKTWLAQQGI
jgi:putative transposase